jgi:hypothetical protein
MNLPAAPMVSNDVMEAAIVRAAELLEEIAPPSAAVLTAFAIQVHEAVEAAGGDPDVETIAQFQMLGMALYSCVEALTMIREAMKNQEAA